ncbi:hypothetical protein H8S90_23725 [Olivibacter sp. SDN3]|uniref:hypothetical protein n=1 Tax=Olivibacter sp. SDN3 TaxID=2764720 RepID=UPI0016517CD6|nr:hypothetical protein [Olivibacter sp. SDN3]QNL49690.1 hypothetical protein H8S90_23725 [Olivibacter sp. SDN3]
MSVKYYFAIFGGLACCLLHGNAKAQSDKVQASLFDGILVAGYADEGAYLNCTGPAVKYIHKSFSVMIGLLPTLKIKKDRVEDNATRNALITPTLGFGMTVSYRHFVVQIPAFYTNKTNVENGRWNPGVGVGYKF